MTHSSRRMRAPALALAAFLLAGLAGLPVTPSKPPVADAHVYASRVFPNNGFLWASSRRSYSGLLYATSNNCVSSSTYPRSVETDVYAKIKASTTGLKWGSNGLSHSVQGCGFTATGLGTGQTATGSYTSNSYDTAVYYDTNRTNFLQTNGSYIGGRVRRQMASSAFCTAWSTSYPCGTRDWVQINKTKWDSEYSATTRVRHLMHENGHANGLADSCETYTIMRNGVSCGFTTFSSWQTHDRTDVNSIY